MSLSSTNLKSNNKITGLKFSKSKFVIEEAVNLKSKKCQQGYACNKWQCSGM